MRDVHVAWAAPTAEQTVSATVRLPGSKSMMARALVLAAISHGTTTLRLPLRAPDTESMASGLRAMGVHVSTVDESQWVVRPRPLTGPAQINVGRAGTVMRFLPPLAGLADGTVAFDGCSIARGRPLGVLADALESLGVEVSCASGRLPLTVHGTGRVHGGDVTIDASASSQFVSGLMLAAPEYDRGVVVRHRGPELPAAPHIRMTVEMLRAAGAGVDDADQDVWAVEPGRLKGRCWDIEPDLSTAAPFLAAALVTGGTVTVPGWPQSSTQAGDQLRALLAQMGGQVSLTRAGLTVRSRGVVHGIDADLAEMSELIVVIAALAALADSPSRLYGIGHLRHHEINRLTLLTRELTKLGTAVTHLPDGLLIEPKAMTGGVFETYGDYRMAHAAAVIGLTVPGVRLSDITCTSKTMPEFAELWTDMVRGAG
jgi:3-phosphoshikimate 1-carboxyvinyltransferase